MEVSGKRKESSESHTKPGCQDDVQLYCQPCQKDGLQVPVHGYCQDCTEHLCESCYETHRKPAPCRHHVLLDKSQMPRSQSSSQLKVPHDLTEQCQQHRGKLIEYFCCDHNILGCSPCITVSHRNCKVDYIPDVSENYVASNAYKQLVHALKTLQENFKKIIAGAKTNKKMILENNVTVKDEIKKFRQEINSMFDNLEANLQKEADDVFAEELARTDNIATRSAKLLEDIENLQDDVNNLEKANRTNALYIKSKGNEALVHVDFTSTMVQTQNKNTVSTFAFQPNLILKEILLGLETRMGELHKSGTESLLSASRKIDYLGQDSFENIQKKIDETLNTSEPAPTPVTMASPFTPKSTTNSKPKPEATSKVKSEVSSTATEELPPPVSQPVKKEAPSPQVKPSVSATQPKSVPATQPKFVPATQPAAPPKITPIRPLARPQTTSTAKPAPSVQSRFGTTIGTAMPAAPTQPATKTTGLNIQTLSKKK